MTNERFLVYRKLILDQVNRLGVASPTQLALDVMSLQNPLLFNKDDFNTTLNELFETGEVLSLYFNSPIDGTKVLYFPRGTKFNFNASVRLHVNS